jgi:hypothetical protein
MIQTTQRVPPLPPEKSAFCNSEDTDNLLSDAKQSLNCLIWLLEGHGLEGHANLEAIRREDMASLLRLIGMKIEHAQAVYWADKQDKPRAANQH